MSVTTSFEGERAPAHSSSANLYRAVWRWHFYAGLLVLPFMISLAVTGALYLFRDEFDNLIHSDLKRIEVVQNAPKALPSEIVSAALAAVPGAAVKYTTPPIRARRRKSPSIRRMESGPSTSIPTLLRLRAPRRIAAPSCGRFAISTV